MDEKFLRFQNEIESLVNQQKDNILLPFSFTNIAIAVSGGADSMCLAYLCSEWAKTQAIHITCLIVDHKLRQESTKEAELVKNMLNVNNLKAVILTIDWEKPEANVHAIARDRRYEMLTEYCKQNNIKHLLTAHNKNDQAETILMRIFRGTGIDGLTGIPKLYNLNGVNILRPFLSFSRDEIENILKSAKWGWVNDPSNLNDKYERSKIRKLIASLPQKELVISRLNLLAKNSLRVRNFLTSYSNDIYKKISKEGVFGEITLDREKFIDLDEEIALRVLTTILNRASGNYYPPRLENLELLYFTIKEDPSFIKTLWGCEINSKKEAIVFYRELKAVEPLKSIIPNQENIWDKRYKIVTSEKGLYVGSINTSGLAMLKTWQKDIKAKARILYSTPGIFKEGKLIFYPILGIGSIPIKNFSFKRKI